MNPALLLGTVLALGALAFVLYPLFFPERVRVARPRKVSAAVAQLGEKEIAVAALREIEFDRATGKLSEADYAQLKAEYTGRALQAMRAEQAGAAGIAAVSAVVEAGALPTDDAIEAAVRAYRASHGACPVCGPRPEPDAAYCSSCGRFLPGACATCGAPATEAGAQFCASCGQRLAA